MKNYLDTLLQYHNWANMRLFDLLNNIPLEEYSKNFGNSFGGIRGTAVHLYGAEFIWMSRLQGISPNSMPKEAEFPVWPNLRETWRGWLNKIDDFREKLDTKIVYQPIEYQTISGQPFTQPVWQIVSHFVNHATYHRGQIVTMARQLEKQAGREPMPIPSLDMVVFYRER